MRKIFNPSTISSIVGIIVSIVIIILGLTTFSYADNFFVASGTEFGADFYTEIFEEVEQIKASTRGIENAIYEVGGLLLISSGAISLCCFLKSFLTLIVKSNKCEKKSDLFDVNASN